MYVPLQKYTYQDIVNIITHILTLNGDIMAQKGYLDYRGILIFWFIILLYHLERYNFIGLKQWTWVRLYCLIGVNGICKCNHPHKYYGIYFTGLVTVAGLL